MKAIKKAVCYKRGQRKPERIERREYTCETGDRVLCQGKEIMVQEVIEDGSEAHHDCGIDWDGLIELVRERMLSGPLTILCKECHDAEHEEP